MSRLTSIQRNALILAGALSAFTLLLIGAVAGRVSHDAAGIAVAPTVTVVPTAEPTAGPDPAVQALLDARDAAYQDVIQQANDRLAQANVQLQSAYAAAAASAAAAARPVAPPAPAYIGPERAAEIALGVVPGAAVQRMPELVNFQGAAAYEVVTSTGSVYVDALSGQLLFNGAAAPVAASGGGGRGDGGGEHEGREDDDDGEEHDG